MGNREKTMIIFSCTSNMFWRTYHTSRVCMAGCWVVPSDTSSLPCSQSNVAFTFASTAIALPEPNVTFITTWECVIYSCKHCSTPTITVTMLFTWPAMSGFVSVGYTPQTKDICVCCQYVHNVSPTRWQHSVKSACFFADKVVLGKRIPVTLFYV